MYQVFQKSINMDLFTFNIIESSILSNSSVKLNCHDVKNSFKHCKQDTVYSCEIIYTE